MTKRSTRKIIGVVATALAFSLTVSAAPADAKAGTVKQDRRDTGWDIP